MAIILDGMTLLATTFLVGFAGALALLTYVTLRPQPSVSSAHNTPPATAQTPYLVVEGNEQVQRGTGRAAQPDQKGADRAA